MIDLLSRILRLKIYWPVRVQAKPSLWSMSDMEIYHQSPALSSLSPGCSLGVAQKGLKVFP